MLNDDILIKFVIKFEKVFENEKWKWLHQHVYKMHSAILYISVVKQVSFYNFFMSLLSVQNT